MTVPGRQGELARIESVCREARSGAGSLVLITGEAGIGKSHLARAVAEVAATLGMARARGWCMDDPGAPVLWPWRRVARDVAGLGPVLDAVQDVDADDGAGFRLVDAVASLFAAQAPGGLAVVLDDLQWADSLSLDLLRRLLQEMGTLPVVVVATAREDARAASPFDRVIPTLLRAPNTLSVPLSGLTAEAVATWLAADPHQREWAAHAGELVRRTGGNPFYIRSLTSQLAPGTGVEVSNALAQRPTWRAVLLAPYRALPEPARRTVATAAVLGERLSPSVLAVALDRPVQQVSDHLAAAVTSGILRFGDTGLAFNHALVRDAVVADLRPDERARAHAGVAAALEATGDPLLAGPAAVHWSQAEGTEAAARCRDLAARAAAASVLAPDRGLELARLALDSARILGADDEELAERLLLVTRLEWAGGMLGEALDSCATGLDLAEKAGRPDLLADFALVPQGVGSVDVARLCGAMCRRALATLPESEATRRARLLALCAVSAAETAQFSPPSGDDPDEPSADVLSARALTAARESRDRQAELETIAARHLVLSYPQAIAERARLAKRAVELSDSATTTMGVLWGHLWRADLAFQRGDVLAVRQAITDVERVADRRSSPVARWHALRLHSALCLLGGDFAEARERALAARAVADRVGDISMIGMHYAFHVQLGLLRGDPSEFLPGALDVLRRAPPIPLVRASLPLISALNGEVARARAEFASLRDIPSRVPLGPRWFGTVAQIGLGAIAVGDASVTRECHRLLLPCARWCGGDGGGSPLAYGSNEYLLGQLAQTFGELSLAAAHFARGIAVDDRIGARPFAALGRLGLAQSLAEADPTRARDLARTAADQLDGFDMPGPSARAVDLLDRLAGPAGRPAERPGGLTEREREVAALVGEALTNQQIAQRLFLSVRTVESHVRSVLAKLGLATRTEIAVWVRDQPRS